MGCPGGHEHDPLYSLSIRNNGLSLYVSRGKGDHYFIQTLPNDLNDLFSHCNLIPRKL